MSKIIPPVGSYQDLVRDHWLKILVAFSFILQLGMIIRGFLKPGRPPLGMGGLFQWGGWYWTQGGVPYYHFWDAKPPLIFETAAILSSVSGGNMYILHVLSVSVTSAAMVGTSIIIGLLAFQQTENELAGLTSGISIFMLPPYYLLSAQNLRPETMGVFFGLLSIYMYNQRNSILSGAFAAIGAGFWQLAIIFPAILLYRARDQDFNFIKKVFVSMGAVTLITLAPFIYEGVMHPLVMSTIVWPVTTDVGTSGNIPLFLYPLRLLINMGYATPLFVICVVAPIALRYNSVSDVTWVGVATGLGVCLVMFTFENASDLYPLFAVSCITVGILYDQTQDRFNQIFISGVALLVALNMIWYGGTGIIPGVSSNDSLIPTQEDSLKFAMSQSDNKIGSNSSPTYSHGYYWNKRMPGDCSDMPFGFHPTPEIDPPGCHELP